MAAVECTSSFGIPSSRMTGEGRAASQRTGRDETRVGEIPTCFGRINV